MNKFKNYNRQDQKNGQNTKYLKFKSVLEIPMKRSGRANLRIVILNYFRDGKEHNINDVISSILKSSELIPNPPNISSPQYSKFRTGIKQEISKLSKKSLIKRIKKNNHIIYRITPQGLFELHNIPESINQEFHTHIQDYLSLISIYKPIINDITKIINTPRIKKKFGLISYIDVLGTKDFWKHDKPEKVLKDWNIFTTDFHNTIQKICGIKSVVTFNTFSDTIIITLESNDVANLLKTFSISTSTFIPKSIESNFPIRGCFSIGNFFNDTNFFIGEAISEAAQYYDLPQWIGISASPSAHAEIERINETDSSISDFYYKCPIPLKQSIEQDAWAVNWPKWIATSMLYESYMPNLINLINKQLMNIKDVSAALKWRNTRKFCDELSKYSSK